MKPTRPILLTIIRAVAEGKVTPGTVLLARKAWADENAPAVEKAPIPSVEHHEKVRRKEARDEDQAKRDMHEAVWTYNLAHTTSPIAPHGRCDCGCGYAFRHHEEGECDHWKGRRGPGAHTRENGWRLRRECHEQKDGRRPMPPGAESFNERRRRYCARAGIPFVPRKDLHGLAP